MRKAISGGATMAPSPMPAVMSPLAMLRSARGNHSATTLYAAGRFTASAKPRNERAAKNPPTPRANACRHEATLHQNTANDSERLLPSRSITGPSSSCPAA